MKEASNKVNSAEIKTAELIRGVSAIIDRGAQLLVTRGQMSWIKK